MKPQCLVVITGLLLQTAPTSAQLVEGKGKVSSVAEALPEVWRFTQTLMEDVNTRAIRSSEDLIKRCREFYTPNRIAEIDRILPGWKHMASFQDARTLCHVNEAMVALLQLDEYRLMAPPQQTVQQWIVLLHDVAKEPVGGRDHRHSFRSAAQAGRILTRLGFPVTARYASSFEDWFRLTNRATRFDDTHEMQIQDNRKLPLILRGVRRVFAEPTRTAVTAIALHQSITSLAAWPVKAPLTDDEAKVSIDKGVLPALLALTLADSGGWNLFDRSTLASMYKETREVFANLARSVDK